jgi:hypothetical protein
MIFYRWCFVHIWVFGFVAYSYSAYKRIDTYVLEYVLVLKYTCTCLLHAIPFALYHHADDQVLVVNDDAAAAGARNTGTLTQSQALGRRRLHRRLALPRRVESGRHRRHTSLFSSAKYRRLFTAD